MKKFIYKIIIISLVVLLVFSAANILYINSDYFKLKIIDWTRFQNIPYDLDIISTGNSHGACALNYSEIENYNCWNFAAAGQTFFYDLQILRQFEEHINDGGQLIIPVTYLSFSKLDEIKQLKHDLRYYRVLKPKFIDDFTISDYLLYKVFPILTSDNELVTALKMELGAVTENPDSYADFTYEEKETSKQQNKIAFFNNYAFDQSQLDSLCDLIEFAINKNMTPVLVTVPVTDDYSELYTKDLTNDFLASIEFVREQYDIEYYDYGRSPDFSSDYALFSNSSHMNKTGALEFTDVFLTMLGLAD